jgi:hypothetical protein
MILCVLVSSSGILLQLVRMATPNVIHLRIKLFLLLTKIWWKV